MKLHNLFFIYLLVISTSGLNAQLRVVSNGNVGIGSNITPHSLLELENNGWLRLNAPSGQSGILFYKSGSSTPTDIQYGGKIFYDGGNDLLSIGTMNNNTFRNGISIRESDGNVGIGTTPSSTHKLLVNGNVQIRNGNFQLQNLSSPNQQYDLNIGNLEFIARLADHPGAPAGHIGTSSQPWNTIRAVAIYGNGVYLGSDERNK
jgi:hypothetical protein